MTKRNLKAKENEMVMVKKGEYWSPNCRSTKVGDVILEKDTLAKVTDCRNTSPRYWAEAELSYDVEFADGTVLFDLSEDELIKL